MQSIYTVWYKLYVAFIFSAISERKLSGASTSTSGPKEKICCVSSGVGITEIEIVQGVLNSF